LANKAPINNQKNIPQKNINKKEITHFIKDQVLNTQDFTASKTIRNTAKDVQSLNRLSHSNNKANLLGAQISLNRDNTATGSVAEIKAPNNKQNSNGI
jgi:hypothetical protein